MGVGEMVKARFSSPPRSLAPLVGLQFTVPPEPQKGTGGLAGAPSTLVQQCERLLRPQQLDLSQHGISLGQSGIPTSPTGLNQLLIGREVTATRVSIYRCGS